MFLSVFPVYELITKLLCRSFIAERQIKHLIVLGLIYLHLFYCFRRYHLFFVQPQARDSQAF